jgi:hypothetical protein
MKAHTKLALFQLIGSIIFLTVSNQACAADWSTVIKNQGFIISVDMDSYDETQGYPSIVTKTRFKKPETTEINSKKISFLEQRATPQFNCLTHQIKTPSIDMLDKRGKTVATDTSKNAFSPVATGSIDAQLESLVCQVHKMVGGM